MIASLIMYTHPQLDGAYDRYWALIRRHLMDAGIACPETLNQNATDPDVWHRPDLVLSQTCGMPYRTKLHDVVTLIGTPDYGLPDCPPGFYRSMIVVRADDPRASLGAFRDATFAYNDKGSQSGYAAPYFHMKENGFWFETMMRSGAHFQSARAVAKGQADIASLDVVTWRFIQKYEGFASGLRVLDVTHPTPGLPYIAARGVDQKVMFSALQAAISELDETDRDALGLRNIVYIPAKEYLEIPNP